MPMMPRNECLRDRIADELAHNDACGPGPVSRQEYEDDADAILRIMREALLNDETVGQVTNALVRASGRMIWPEDVRSALDAALPGTEATS